jgi:hypothetical protein
MRSISAGCEVRGAGISAALAAIVGLGGCLGSISGDLRVDGAPFVPKTCHSGAGRGFVGVELEDADHRWVRVIVGPPRTSPPWFLAQSGSGPAFVSTSNLGPEEFQRSCGSITLEEEHVRMGVHRLVKGAASVQCESPRRSVVGTVRFADCD